MKVQRGQIVAAVFSLLILTVSVSFQNCGPSMSASKNALSITAASTATIYNSTEAFRASLPEIFSGNIGNLDGQIGRCFIDMANAQVNISFSSVTEGACAEACRLNAQLFSFQSVTCSHGGKSFYNRASRSTNQCQIHAGNHNQRREINSRMTVAECSQTCQNLVNELDLDQDLQCFHNRLLYLRQNSQPAPLGSCIAYVRDNISTESVHSSLTSLPSPTMNFGEAKSHRVYLQSVTEITCDSACEQMERATGRSVECKFHEVNPVIVTPEVDPRAAEPPPNLRDFSVGSGSEINDPSLIRALNFSRPGSVTQDNLVYAGKMTDQDHLFLHQAQLSSISRRTFLSATCAHCDERDLFVDIQDGRQNVEGMIDLSREFGSPMLLEEFPAAQVCNQYSVGDFNDWYLPSRLELNFIFQNRSQFTGLRQEFYWSSTEGEGRTAFSIHLGNGLTEAREALLSQMVLCVRRVREVGN